MSKKSATGTYFRCFSCCLSLFRREQLTVNLFAVNCQLSTINCLPFYSS
ncbi:MAG: hypothetical protein HC942_19625 [Microcoleus sp. SU_5_6]|nr:hypothetical protein [Microcoleus sp. SU_5_6]